MALNLEKTRQCLTDFDFSKLFVEELGWSLPISRRSTPMVCGEHHFTRKPIAQMKGVIVFEVVAESGAIPDQKTQSLLHKEISALHHENLIVLVDGNRTQSLWYWGRRENKRVYPCKHEYFKGQPGDLFLSKLASMHIDLNELDEKGELPLVDVLDRLKKALDIERVTKKFYGEFQHQHLSFLKLIKGIDDDRDRRWYASVMLNRLMFVWFLQKKFFLDNGDGDYLQSKLVVFQKSGRDLYFEKFLKILFFEGFAKPEGKRTPQANKLLGKIKYLNGGLFLPHPIEQRWPKIAIPDKAFENLYELFNRFSWNLNDTPGGEDDKLNPDVLGYIFEKYINQKAFGAYYTRPEITEYLCERTIHRLILDKVESPGIPGVIPPCHFNSMGDLLIALDAPLCKSLIHDILPNLRLLDPACGSAAFLVAAMKTLTNVYSAVVGRIKFLNDRNLTDWLKNIERGHPNVNYFIKKKIITENLFGVDIMEEAVEIAKLRLFLALVAAAGSVEDLEPLPNIDFNILSGNSLMGLLHVDSNKFEQSSAGRQEKKKLNHVPVEGELGFAIETKTGSRKQNLQAEYFSAIRHKKYAEVLTEKNRLVSIYRHATGYAEDLSDLRNQIIGQKKEAIKTLHAILLDQFAFMGIKYEQATWDDRKNDEGKSIKRSVNSSDIEALTPFHWGFEFDEIINQHGGFDAIITNPPWEIFKPNSKEFFEEYSDLITKKKMTIHDFEAAQVKLLKDPEIRKAWLEYLSGYPHVSTFFRSADQYKHQISIVDGKKAGTDANLYKLFTEQCFNLLRKGGYCGIVVPSGIYTDLGTKQLREMLFVQTKITGLFCFDNRKEIFEGVHRSYKFLVLSFEKGEKTKSFPTAFMRADVEELERFPQEGAIMVSVDLIRRLSPDSLSIMEFKTSLDVTIAEKMLTFPLLGEELPNKWNLILTREFDMTNDSSLFQSGSGKGRFPLYEGKMVWQFDHLYSAPRFWIEEKVGRKALLGREQDKGQELDYQGYRVGFRSAGENTNERNFISTVFPRNMFCGNSIILSQGPVNENKPLIVFLCAMFNSFTLDYMIRLKISRNLNMFYIYQLPVPRLAEKDAVFWSTVKRAARLICTMPEFDDLAKEVGLESHKDGITDPSERAKIRAELDGMIAHLYGLTEEEFAHILATFPIVPQPVKDAALQAYHDLAPKSGDQQIAALIAQGESATLEFKSSARWDMKENKQNKELEKVIVKTVAAFLNTNGGTLLVGVDDAGVVVGLQHDYKTMGRKQNRDGYENWLTTLLLDAYGKDKSPLIQISFHQVEGHDICRIDLEKSPQPIYVKDDKGEHLFIRTGNSTRLLSTREAVEYVKNNWSSGGPHLEEENGGFKSHVKKITEGQK